MTKFLMIVAVMTWSLGVMAQDASVTGQAADASPAADTNCNPAANNGGRGADADAAPAPVETPSPASATGNQ